MKKPDKIDLKQYITTIPSDNLRAEIAFYFSIKETLGDVALSSISELTLESKEEEVLISASFNDISLLKTAELKIKEIESRASYFSNLKIRIFRFGLK
ncbi:MAG: hypothetical protein N2440_00460 [Actinobacteria bacterium]|nr:hypothetical protein [Actinomycetota bacterium]